MSQKSSVLEILKDGNPHSTFEIMERLYPSGKAGLFRLGARIWDLQQDGCEIRGWHDPQDAQKYWYQLTEKVSPDQFKVQQSLFDNKQYTAA